MPKEPDKKPRLVEETALPLAVITIGNKGPGESEKEREEAKKPLYLKRV